MALFCLLSVALLWAFPTFAQNQTPDWQAQVRKHAEAHDWDSAMRLVDQQIARAPQDMDIRAWRARVLAWADRFPEADKEYREILKVTQGDPDNWLGLAGVCLREGKIQEAEEASERAEELDPKRADVHAARARVLRAAGRRDEARLEFQKALILDPRSTEAKAGLVSVRGERKHELRFGQDNDLLSYTSAYRDEWASLSSQWNSHWGTSVSGNFYQRGGADAGKFNQPKFRSPGGELE